MNDTKAKGAAVPRIAGERSELAVLICVLAFFFVSGASATFVQGVFSSTYALNNPWVVEEFADMPVGFDLQFFIMMLVPFIGIASALALGFLTFLAVRVLGRH